MKSLITPGEMQVYHRTDMKSREKAILALSCLGRKAITDCEPGTSRCPSSASVYIKKPTSTLAQKTSVQVARKRP